MERLGYSFVVVHFYCLPMRHTSILSISYISHKTGNTIGHLTALSAPLFYLSSFSLNATDSSSRRSIPKYARLYYFITVALICSFVLLLRFVIKK